MIHDPIQIDRARKLRRNLTFAESRLWKELKSKKLAGFKFRKQHPIGQYITDFCCISAKVIVELDGDAHIGRKYEDGLRDQYFRDCGFEVIRFENCDTKYEENRVIETILKTCLKRRDLTEVIATTALHP